MSNKFLNIAGTLVKPSMLSIPKAKALAQLLAQNDIDFASLIECYQNIDTEIIVFDVEVELGQLLKNPIQRIERIAAIFFNTDNKMPDTLSLRPDFPSVPHLNLCIHEFPRSLCLYQTPYEELKRNWTAPRYVERIRTWLRLTAIGKLHSIDQPLEPLLLDHYGYIVLPSDLLESKCVQKQLYVNATKIEPGSCFLISSYHKEENINCHNHIENIIFECNPQTHGIIHNTPKNLAQLNLMTTKIGLDLLESLRVQIQKIKNQFNEDNQSENKFLNSPLNLILIFPKTRIDGGNIEDKDIYSFFTLSTIRDIGKDIGLWEETGGNLGQLIQPPPEKTGNNIRLNLLNPIFWMTREKARKINDIRSELSNLSIACVGAGALGSQVIMNLARAGFGCWSIIDKDVLLPHNLSRHILFGYNVGYQKAESVALLANSLTDNGNVFYPFVDDVLNQNKKNNFDIHNTFRSSNIIIDASASVAVARYLANDIESSARRISIFLNTTGEDLVFLLEDRDRKTKLDEIEMQYYRELLYNKELIGHFIPLVNQQQYGQSCRDLTNIIPQDQMALHAAIASRAIRQSIDLENSQIIIWRANEDLSVRKISVFSNPTIRKKLGSWNIRLDENLLLKLHKLRDEKLPKETGGILIGSFDFERKIVYLVDTIPSPPDSTEWPFLYIRGTRCLKSKVENIFNSTDGALEYVGEWHSHPVNYSTAPSNDDKTVFKWLKDHVKKDGLPPLMMIVGDVGRVSCFIETIKSDECLI